MLKDLNQNQLAFVLAYVEGDTLGNATQSAIKAGYTPDNAARQGYDLLTKNASVRKAIDDFNAEAIARTKITKDRVMAELGRIGFADIRSVVNWGAPGDAVRDGGADTGAPDVTENRNALRLVSSDEVHPGAAAAIAEISQGPHGLKVKMHSKTAALVELGRHLGIAQKVALTGPTGEGPVETITREMTAEQAAEYYRRTLEGE